MPRSLISTSALLLALGSPLVAQDLCGGSGSGGQWIGGSEERSDMATSDTYQEQMALVLGGNAYVGLFSLSAPTDVRIEAAGRGGGDPLIEVFDAAGGIVASDDDSGGGGAARSEVSLEAGTYCVNMKPYDSGPMTAFLRVGRMDQEPLTDGAATGGEGSSPSNDCSAATPMGEMGAANTASVEETSHWSFSLAEPTAITITANSDGADPTIALFDSSGATLAENDDFDGLNSRITQSNPLPAGDYCIGMGALSDTTAPITTTLTIYDAAAELAALYARGEAAPPLDGSVVVTDLGEVASRLRQDVQVGSEVAWYSMNVTESSLILIEAIAAGENSDPWLVIFDDLGRKMGENDDSDGLNSLLTARVQPGTYIFGVKQVGDNQGFVRLLIERYVPAK